MVRVLQKLVVNAADRTGAYYDEHDHVLFAPLSIAPLPRAAWSAQSRAMIERATIHGAGRAAPIS